MSSSVKSENVSRHLRFALPPLRVLEKVGSSKQEASADGNGKTVFQAICKAYGFDAEYLPMVTSLSHIWYAYRSCVSVLCRVRAPFASMAEILVSMRSQGDDFVPALAHSRNPFLGVGSPPLLQAWLNLVLGYGSELTRLVRLCTLKLSLRKSWAHVAECILMELCRSSSTRSGIILRCQMFLLCGPL